MLLPADQVDVTVIIDNVTDSLSSTPAFVENEWTSHWRRGMKSLGGRCLCCAAHGLSCLVTVTSGANRRTILFDTGPEEWVFERNVSRLGIDLGTVDALVLSHGHWDHAGAAPYALAMANLANGGRAVPTYLHPDMFRLRALKMPDGAMRLSDAVPSMEIMEANGGTMVCTTEPVAILDGMAFVSGEIPRSTSFEQGLQAQWHRTDDGTWEHDPWIMDERYLAVHVKGKGLVVFSACSHAGIVNVLLDVRRRFPALPIHAVMGGLHLSGITEGAIPDTVAALKEFEIAVLAVGHCTGWRAVNALSNAFGNAVVPSAVGKTYRF